MNDSFHCDLQVFKIGSDFSKEHYFMFNNNKEGITKEYEEKYQ